MEAQPIVVKMKVQNLVTGLFANPNTGCCALPRQVNEHGIMSLGICGRYLKHESALKSNTVVINIECSIAIPRMPQDHR